jgi:protein subunit release factor B
MASVQGVPAPGPAGRASAAPAPAQVRNYVLHPYKMVKDLRTGVETGNAAGVLDGDLDPFVQAFLRHKGRGGSAASQG